MHSIVKIFGTLLALLFISGCGPSEALIKGNVFVATKGGVNYKLALIDVKISPEIEFSNVVKTSADPINAQMKNRSAEITKMISVFRDTEIKYNDKLHYYLAEKDKIENDLLRPPQSVVNKFTIRYFPESFTLFIQARYTDGEKNGYKYDFTDPVLTNYLDLIESQHQKIGKLYALLNPLYIEVSKLFEKINADIAEFNSDYKPIAELLWGKAKAGSRASSVSDADGNFSFTVNSTKDKKFVVFADGVRSTGAGDENYRWMRNVDLNATNGRDAIIMLSNNELINDLNILSLADFNLGPIYFSDKNCVSPTQFILKISKFK